MHELIREDLLKKLDNPVLRQLSDSAVINAVGKTAFTTDSFVVSPLFFPGADIGKLAVCGTVNDLVMQGAQPEYLSLALIIEEGLERSILAKIIDSISLACRASKVSVVTGDLKVVEKKACDKIFINTSGIGRIIKRLSIQDIRPGDKIIVTGTIGQHGMSVLAGRKDLGLGFKITSDCAGLAGLLIPLLRRTDCVKFMRDPTRGGLATTLNEISRATGMGIVIDENKIPVSREVRAASELSGIDPLYVACEGRAVVVAERKSAARILSMLKRHALAHKAQIIGEVSPQYKGRVVLNTVIGTQRIVDMLASDPLPRIC